MYYVQVQYYVIQYKPRAATWDYKEISGAITNFYDIRGLRYCAWTVRVVHKLPQPCHSYIILCQRDKI